MSVPKGGALGLSDAQIEYGRALDKARRGRVQEAAEKERRIIETAASIGAARAAGERMAEAVEPSTTAVADPREGRSLGTGTQQALIAAFIVFADTLGSSKFPASSGEMARAIVDTAKGLNLGKPLDPRSSSVKRVAKMALDAKRLSDQKDNKRTPR